MGVTGLETAFSVLHTDLVLPGVLELGVLVERMSAGAAPFGFELRASRPGERGELVLFDPEAEWEAGAEGWESRSHNSCFAGRGCGPGADDGRRGPGRLPPAQLRDGGVAWRRPKARPRARRTGGDRRSGGVSQGGARASTRSPSDGRPGRRARGRGSRSWSPSSTRRAWAGPSPEVAEHLPEGVEPIEKVCFSAPRPRASTSAAATRRSSAGSRRTSASTRRCSTCSTRGSRCTSPRDAVGSRFDENRRSASQKVERRGGRDHQRRDGAVRAARRGRDRRVQAGAGSGPRVRAVTAAGYVLLEDGTRFDGELCGAAGRVTGEVVFNTAMTGYQESVTDPSYAGQIITFTYPLIGNYGVCAAAMESDRVQARGGDHARGEERRGRGRRRGRLARLARRLRRAGDRRRRHPGARAPHPRPRRDARRDLPRRAAEAEARERVARRAADGRRRLRADGDAGRADRDRRRRAPTWSGSTPGSSSSIIRQLRERGCRLTLLPCTAPPRRSSAERPRPGLPRQRPRRPGGARLRRRDRPRARRQAAGGRHLPRPPAPLPGGRPRDLQAAVRPPRRQPPGQGPGDGADRDHLPEPRLRGRRARTASARSRATSRCAGRPTSAPPSSPT